MKCRECKFWEKWEGSKSRNNDVGVCSKLQELINERYMFDYKQKDDIKISVVPNYSNYSMKPIFILIESDQIVLTTHVYTRGKYFCGSFKNQQQ